jgi:hypothetical protein
MTWDDMEELLHDGTAEEIKQIHCPECGGIIRYYYAKFDDDDSSSINVACDKCGLMSFGYLASGHTAPNCVEYFGTEARLDENLKLLKTA